MKDIERTLMPGLGDKALKQKYYDAIRNILMAYTNFNKNVGYVQGMNIIASCLLYNVCNGDYELIETYEEQSFWLFACLMEKYEIKLCFSRNMKKVFDLSDSLEFNLQKNQGVVFNHINRSDVYLQAQHLHILRQSVFHTGPAHSTYNGVRQDSRPDIPMWSK